MIHSEYKQTPSMDATLLLDLTDPESVRFRSLMSFAYFAVGVMELIVEN